MTTNVDIRETAASYVSRLLQSTPVRVLALVLLFTASAWHEGANLVSLFDGDVWWHLRTGSWILQNHAVPHSGLFSQHSDLPWLVSSWGFDLILAIGYKLLGLRVIPALLMGFSVALAVVTFLLACGPRKYFWTAIFLSSASQYALLNLPPRSELFSILLFGIELILLSRSGRSGKVHSLYWLPVLFVCWANLDIQFVYGLLVLGLFLGAAFIERLLRTSGVAWFRGSQLRVPLRTIGSLTGASIIASMVSPYSYHPFEAFLQRIYGSFSFPFLKELHSMDFRQPQHYAVLLLAMGAFLTLGHQRSCDLFKLSTMIVCTSIAFSRQAELWFVVLPTIFVIADALYAGSPVKAQMGGGLSNWENAITAGMTILILAVAVSRIPSGEKVLLETISKNFPVQASNFIRDSRLPSPLFNAYAWGGFLIWYMPDYPVAIDGRNDLYGAELNDLYFKVTNGIQPLDTDVDFVNSGTFMLEKHSAVGEALARMPGYSTVYSDDLAIVLRRSQ